MGLTTLVSYGDGGRLLCKSRGLDTGCCAEWDDDTFEDPGEDGIYLNQVPQ